MNPAKRKVVVTGLGLLTPLGPDVQGSWERLCAGNDARRPVTLFDVSGCRCREGAQVELPGAFPARAPKPRRLTRASMLAISAVREALADAGLLRQDGSSLEPRLVLSVSTTAGAMSNAETFLRHSLAGTKKGLLGPIARYQPQQQILDLQETFGFRGPATIIANACASGANALGHAADLIRNGRADCVLAGGYEALTELVYAGFDSLQALSPDCCRPFDLNRNGLMLGEGAGFVVLESEERARQRGVRHYCELSGYGQATDLHHLTQPSPGGEALIRVMEQAVKRSGIDRREISYVNAHGTATPMNDGAEAAAYVSFFGEGFKRLKISSTKAAIGHTLGAAGAVEAVFAIQVLRTGQLPPQLHTREAIPEMRPVLPAQGDVLQSPRHAMSVNLGFGGSNAALIFSKL
ncbi:MAG: beta-ketoacyl-[acyl-carrier-protein] synthase family protein [Methylacidiphilales bacterium]|nr:beta-ketoacyl-[acyl-carrier-protein] synthase family protein [Candidatus Methylacidiphilales bacterium]